MLVELPKECTGQEIVNAFLAVSKRKDALCEEDKAGFWQGTEFVPLDDGIKYSPKKSKREIIKTGVRLSWYSLHNVEHERRWWQLRPKVTREMYPSWLNVQVRPLRLDYAYTEVEVNLKDIPKGYHSETIVDLYSPFHKEAARKFQKLIGQVWETLSPGSIKVASPKSAE